MYGNMILKGNILYMSNKENLEIIDDGYLVVESDLVVGVYQTLPQIYDKEEVRDFGDRLIIPGMTDLHVHAPQYSFRGLGMDKELLDWLNQYAFPEEMRYSEDVYAKKAYRIFAQDLLESPTTRACVFATAHKEASLHLAKMLEESGLVTYVGKVNMDRNSIDGLQEDTKQSLEDTRWFIEEMQKKCKLSMPMLTPRFVPSCTDELMQGLGELQREYQLPVQSHLSENLSEIEWVAELNPKSKNYGDAYEMFGLFGDTHPAVMAHCVYCSEEELALMKKNGVFIAHCPNSNMSLASGIAPIRSYLSADMKVGLGSDVAAGFSLSMFHAIRDAISVSKLYWRLVDKGAKPLTTKEGFYLATMGGGSFFGKVGSFLPGYQADILVLDDSKYRSPRPLSSQERLERLCYLSDTDVVYTKFVQGREVFSRDKKVRGM